MPPRLDAHAHFFAPGYVSVLPESCRRVQPDEVTLYAALAERHAVECVLAVGYEGAPWAAGNNAYVARLARRLPWIRPLAYVDPVALTPAFLQEAQTQGFVGISLYLMDQARAAQLGQVPPAVWAWLAQRRWLVSVNSRETLWQAWQPVLAAHPHLRLLISHLGLPPKTAAPPPHDTAADRLAAVCALAVYPEVHVKLSALYGLTDPGHDYPHRAAWPYIETVAAAYTPHRLLWGSDFSPALEHVSFAQTLAVVDQLDWLSADERAAILGATLARLLQSIPAKEVVE